MTENAPIITAFRPNPLKPAPSSKPPPKQRTPQELDQIAAMVLAKLYHDYDVSEIIAQAMIDRYK